MLSANSSFENLMKLKSKLFFDLSVAEFAKKQFDESFKSACNALIEISNDLYLSEGKLDQHISTEMSSTHFVLHSKLRNAQEIVNSLLRQSNSERIMSIEKLLNSVLINLEWYEQKRKYGSILLSSIKGIFPIDRFDEVISQNTFNLPVQILNEDRIKMFQTKGRTCVNCQKEALIIVIENVHSNAYNGLQVNLYHNLKTLIGKDHIIPKSKNGADHLENYQPMCYPCNSQKGAKI